MRNKLIIAIASSLTLAYWMVVIFRIQVFRIIPDFFWHSMLYIDKNLKDVWLIIPVIFLSIIVVLIVFRKPENYKFSLLMLVFLGWCLQMAFGFMEGRGIEGIRYRMVATGHAEFARIAAQEKDIHWIAANYEEILQVSDSARYVHTKPPGQLLFYMFTERVANAISPGHDANERYAHLITFASYVYPALTYLVLLPLFYFARFFMKDEFALKACIIYLFLPNVILTTLHLDQALYPTLVMLCLFLISHAYHRISLIWGVLCGVAIYLALYMSFSLLPIILTVPVLVIIFLLRDNSKEKKARNTYIPLIGVLSGLIIMFLGFKLLLNYDPFIRYQNALAYHQNWQKWEPGISNILLYGIINYIEYACWIGIPVAIVFVSNVWHSFRNLTAGRSKTLCLTSLCIALVFILIAVFGRTKGESARLWIFMAAPICVFVSQELYFLFRKKSEWVLSGLLIIQLITTLIIKRYQDFW
jgi:hypothetical protein